MARYNFFSKKGRPTKVEKEICQKIKSIVDNPQDIDPNLIDEFCATEGVPSTQEELETLYAYLTGETPLDYGSSSDIEEDYTERHNNANNTDEYEDDYSQTEEPIKMNKKGTSDVNYDPFNEPVIERGYTKGFVENEDIPSEQDIPAEEDIPTEEDIPSEQDIPNPNVQDVEFTEEDLDIPEPDYVQNQSIGFSDEGEDDEYEGEDDEFDEDGGALNEGNLQDLSPAQKRKSAEKTADAILMMYSKVVPVPFEKWASINDGTVQKLALNDRIDLNMELENDLTVQQYVDSSNEQVKEVFKVTDETKEEIKEPLVEVLLEQELALTPTQRLMLAVGSHIATMGFSAYQLAQSNKRTLEAFEKYHNDRKKGASASRPAPSQPVTPVNDNLSEDEMQMAYNLMQEMEGNNEIIDAETDPSVEVTTEPNE